MGVFASPRSGCKTAWLGRLLRSITTRCSSSVPRYLPSDGATLVGRPPIQIFERLQLIVFHVCARRTTPIVTRPLSSPPLIASPGFVSFSSALWLKVPVDFCHYISIAAHYGFKLHHTQPKYVMMSLWLPEDVPNKIPEFGTHHLGVAGVSTDCGGCKRCCGQL